MITSQLITIFTVVESIKKRFSTQQGNDSRRSDEKVKELLDEIEKFKSEFESIDKPGLESEAPVMREETPPSKARTPRISFLSNRQKNELNPESSENNEAQRGGISLAFSAPTLTLPLIRSRSMKAPETETKHVEHVDNMESLVMVNGKKSSDAEAQLSQLKLELELENHSRGSSMEGIIDWEFDEKEHEKLPTK